LHCAEEKAAGVVSRRKDDEREADFRDFFFEEPSGTGFHSAILISYAD